MLERYRDIICALPPRVALLLTRQLQLPRAFGGRLYRVLEEGGYCQADIALALLHSREYAACEALVGRPIVHLPYSRPPEPRRPLPRRQEALTVVAVARNPRLPTTDAFQRFRAIKVGLSVEQLLVRGVRTRDLREWTREGSVKLAVR